MRKFFILVILLSLDSFLKPAIAEDQEDLDFTFSGPIEISISPQTNKVFILNHRSNEITVFDEKKKKAIANIPTGGEDSGTMRMGEDSGTLFVLNRASNDITVFPGLGLKEDFSQDSIDQILKERRLIPAGRRPLTFAADKVLRKIYVLDKTNAILSIIDQRTKETTRLKIIGEPHRLAVNPETHKVYVVSGGSNLISVINGKTNELIKTLSFGSFLFDITVDRKENRIFVSSQGDDSIYILDGKTDEIITNIKSGGKSSRVMEFNDVTKKLYVSHWLESSLAVIDTQNYTFLKKISLPAGSNPDHFTVIEDLNLIFVPNTELNNVSIIDGKQDQIIATLGTGIFPLRPVFNRGTNEVYIPNSHSNNITIISKITERQFQSQTIPEQEKIIRPERNFSHPFRLAVNEKTNEIYVLNARGNFVIVDGKTYEVKDKILVGGKPREILFSTDLNKIFVSNSDDDSITIYNLRDKSQRNVSVGDKPTYLLFNPKTKKLYVTNLNSQNISVIDAEKEIHFIDIPFKGRPEKMILNSKENRIYVIDSLNDEIVVINGETNQILERVKVGVGPVNLLYDENFNRLYVANRVSRELNIIDGSSNQILKTLDTVTFHGNMGLNKMQKKIYLSESRIDDNRIKVINLDSLEFISPDIRTSKNPGQIVIDQEKQKLLVLALARDNLDIVDLKTNQLLRSINIRTLGVNLANLRQVRLEDMVFNSKTNKLFIALGEANALAVVDTEKNLLELLITDERVIRVAPPEAPIPFPYLKVLLGVLGISLIILGIIIWKKWIKRKKELAIS